MLKVKDTIIAGVLAGWMGNVVKETLTWSFYFMGWVSYTFVHIASGFYYSKENIDAPFSLVTGAITDWTIAGTFGVVLLYLLRYTGSDYAVFKGIGLGSLVYIYIWNWDGIGYYQGYTYNALTRLSFTYLASFYWSCFWLGSRKIFYPYSISKTKEKG